MNYWYIEYEEFPNKEVTKTFLVKNPSLLGARCAAYYLIGPGKCTIVPLTVEHLIKRIPFHNQVSVFYD